MKIYPSQNTWPLTRNQLRAGRILARLGIRELAQLAGLSTATISQVETGTTTKPHLSTLIRLKSSLQEQGIEFVDGGWMRHLDDSGHEQDASQTDVENELFHANIIENARLLTYRLLRILSKASQQPSKPGTAQEE